MTSTLNRGLSPSRPRRTRLLIASAIAIGVATGSAAPLAAQDVPNPLVVLQYTKKQVRNLEVSDRIALINFLRPANDQLDCDDLEDASCDRATRRAVRQLRRAGPSPDWEPQQVQAFGMLNTWRDADQRRQDRQDENDAEEDNAPVEAKAQEADDTAAKATAAEREARLQAKREERRKRRSAAAAATDDDDAGAEVEEEVVTTETARSSAQDAALKPEDNDDKLLKAIGAVGAALAVGSFLDNGDEVVEQKGDRLVVRRDGQLLVRKDENELIRRPGSNVRTRTFDDGSTRTIVTKPNGNKVITIRDADGYTVRRVRELPDGSRVTLFDDTAGEEEEVNLNDLPRARAETVEYSARDEAALRRALRRDQGGLNDRRYSLRQVRENHRLRESVPQIDLDAINFETGSAAITPREARDLSVLGNTIAEMIEENPREVFLIEGHTDAVGSDVSNLALSDRRAESVALALTEYFDVPPENLVVQGYGESFLKIQTQESARQNRRASVRRITPLLRSAALR